MHYKTIDLCAGIGGIRRGFELTGKYENVLASEIDKYACATYEHVFGENPENDLTTERFKQMVETIQYDVLLAGFPCQSFSNVGKKEGFSDASKGTIFFHIAEIIRRTRPKAVLLENVDHFVRHDHGNTLHVVLQTLVNDLEYKVIGVTRDINGDLTYKGKDFIRNSRYFGVPQNRPRTYIVAFDRRTFSSICLNMTEPLPYAGERQIYKDLNDVLEMGAPEQFYLSSGYYQTLINHRNRQKTLGNGFGYRIVNSPDIEYPIANTLLATGGSGRERNMVIDWQDDIPGRRVVGKLSPLNDECVRFMTPREWGKLQGFIGYAFIDNNGNDTFEFPENISIVQQYKQFGNSVTIPVIECIAKYILRYLNMLNQ
jgi:DNA (cytosine-5)-methyltransferase 1